jgi:hypothetical protein
MEKISHTKAFFANPISYVAGMIALGSVVFAWGVSSANKGNSVSVMGKQQTEQSTKIDNIQTSMSIQHQEWTRFMIRYDADKKIDSVFKNKLYNGFIVLDTAMVKHLRLTNRTEERLQFMEDQLKKNSNLYDQVIPTPLNINTTSLLKRSNE